MRYTIAVSILLLCAACVPLDPSMAGYSYATPEPSLDPAQARLRWEEYQTMVPIHSTSTARALANELATIQAAATQERAAQERQVVDAENTRSAASTVAAAAMLAATRQAADRQATPEAATLQAAYSRDTATAASRATATQARQAIISRAAATQQARAMRYEPVIYDGLVLFGGLVLVVLFLSLVWVAGALVTYLERICRAAAAEREAAAAAIAIITLADGRDYRVTDGAYLSTPAALQPGEPEPDRILKTNRGEPIHVKPSAAERYLTAAMRAGLGASAIIPPAAQIGWSGEARMDAMLQLGKLIMTKPGSPKNGGGTFIQPPYRSIAALLTAIQHRQVQLSDMSEVSEGVK